MATDIKEEIANYLLNNCFLMGTVDTTREKYYYVINHEESFRQIFLPIGYTLVIHRNLRVVQLINNHGSGRIALRKYESIILLIFRLLYVEKRESLSTNEDRIYATCTKLYLFIFLMESSKKALSNFLGKFSFSYSFLISSTVA